MTNDFIQPSRPLFGPSGTSLSFAAEGHKSTMEVPRWIKERNLDIFEYSLGRGATISSKTASEIGEEACRQGVEMSVHAPYFINFSSSDPQKALNSIGYILTSLKILRCFRGRRCVFHAGSESGQNRADAFAKCLDMLAQALAAVEVLPEYGDMLLCPETMGKQAQIGTVDEVVEMCKLSPILYPCIDFGHVNALYGGSLKKREDFQRIVDKLFDGLGEEKTKNMHVHFSKIQYASKGELRHLTFADEIYGPEFEPFAEVIAENSLTPHILSESAGTQAEDAAAMRDMWLNAAGMAGRL